MIGRVNPMFMGEQIDWIDPTDLWWFSKDAETDNDSNLVQCKNRIRDFTLVQRPDFVAPVNSSSGKRALSFNVDEQSELDHGASFIVGEKNDYISVLKPFSVAVGLRYVSFNQGEWAGYEHEAGIITYGENQYFKMLYIIIEKTGYYSIGNRPFFPPAPNPAWVDENNKQSIKTDVWGNMIITCDGAGTFEIHHGDIKQTIVFASEYVLDTGHDYIGLAANAVANKQLDISYLAQYNRALSIEEIKKLQKIDA